MIEMISGYNIPDAGKITDNYISAWDIFTIENMRECRNIRVSGISVYDLPEKLKDWGIYLAETREDV